MATTASVAETWRAHSRCGSDCQLCCFCACWRPGSSAISNQRAYLQACANSSVYHPCRCCRALPCCSTARGFAPRGCRTWKRNKTKSALGRFFLALPCCGSHPVHQDVQPKPDHVHKMPIPGSALKAKVALGREMPVLQPQSDEEQHQHANEHVEAVKTRQHEEG